MRSKKYIRGYEVDLSSSGTLEIGIGRATKIYPRLPSMDEVNEALGTAYTKKKVDAYYPALYSKDEMVASPRFPDDGLDYMRNGLTESESMKIPPMLQDVDSFINVLAESGIVIPPTIPKTATSLSSAFREAAALRMPASIPTNVEYMSRIYDGCTSLTGEFVMRPQSMLSSRMSNALRGTVGSLVIYGKQSVCEALAATANNGNAQWSDWYDPVQAVTDRGPGSYTTAADMTRMVRNGVLAVDTYAPGRMVYQQGDIVREDEWKALVEAAQTIDQTVTFSSHYENLNKIEAAFASRL